MNQSKVFFYLAIFNVLLALTVIADCHFLPRKIINEKFDFVSGVESRSRSSHYHTTYFVCKSGRKYQVPEDFHFELNGDSSLAVQQSVIFQIPMTISSPSASLQNESSISQIDIPLFLGVIIGLIITSFYVIVNKRTISSSGYDFLLFCIAFYVGFILIVFW
ncbi:hypothetical protein [Pinibacter aurantiacus]|uniref:Uncharacterized protein n=1 Tax=Pinibacter aurantiacus TaxID=2851599 RepID=A0A9E2SA53_9BACT|nr:hypothetical protein [Pinibacter aurantiacus]MBV4359273.1 hypothetical protein [Pinibacter aurantiacus]